MLKPTIWHNPKCSKSRQTLAILDEIGAQPTIRLYLKVPPTSEELLLVLSQLGIETRALMRTKEALYRELALMDETNPTALIQAMVDHPKLIERPIVIRGSRAVIGRPPESVHELFNTPEQTS